MAKMYKIELLIEHGSDEWWDENPSLKEIAQEISEQLYSFRVEKVTAEEHINTPKAVVRPRF